MSQIEVKMGQEWYFYANSTTYVVYKIELCEYKYRDGEILDYDTVIYLRGLNNTTITKRPEEFNENDCKLIKDNLAHVPADIKTIPVPLRKRLDTVE